MYIIVRRTEGDELVQVAKTDDRAQAERLLHSLNKLWPAEYEIKESQPSEGQEKEA